MDCTGRCDHIVYHLPTYLETHLAVHRVGWQAMNLRFAIFRSIFPLMSDKNRIQSVLEREELL